MQTRVGYYADKLLEMGWLMAAVMVPLFFNVYSSRVFEPDKISLLRSLVLVMAAVWIIKLAEGGYRAFRQRAEEPTPGNAPGSRRGKVASAVNGAAAAGAPSWWGFPRVPMLIPIFVYALAYLISSLLTVTPYATLWGSYQRLQGTYTQYSYIMLALIVIVNMRSRAQFERLINFMLLTSLPVALYGFLQAARLDPLPWAGDTASRVASSMGNAIFVAAWLIMVTPFAAYRLFTGLTATYKARAESRETVEAPLEGERRRPSRVRYDVPSYGWAVVTAGVGVIFIQLFFFFLVLKVQAGLAFPDAATWWMMPLGLLVFFVGAWALEWLGRRRDDPAVASLVLPIVGVTFFIVLALTLVFTWSIERVNLPNGSSNVAPKVGLDGSGFLWVLFFMLLWATIGAGAYALAASERLEGDTTPSRGITHVFLNIGYAMLLFIQILAIYLTQSRGPWLGFGAAFVTFAVAMWLVGRRSGVRWMARIGGGVSVVLLAAALFVAALNIPGSPLQSLDNLPVVGRGIERLSTLTQTESGTGKVRELIWKGATDLILSNPLRAVIGWGPEAMYVAYNPFYPPELAQVELRNATPDRSHNVEFDHLVTMGVMGLLAYYFLVGSFFVLGIKALKRARGTRDQLLLITLISAMAAHFIEIQTGIQIASTWTYFYLLAAQLAVFAYFLNPYLRHEPAAIPETSLAATPAYAGTPAAQESLPAEEARAAARVSRGGAGVALAEAGNGRGSQSHPPGVSQGRGRGRSSPIAGPQNGRRRQGTAPARDQGTEDWISTPASLALYVGLLVGAVLLAVFFNESGVQADTLYKQGQSYDNVRRWSDATDFYEQAIALQPNQDYYYLFLGRSWLEFAKDSMGEKEGNFHTHIPYTGEDSKDPAVAEAARLKNDQARKTEELFRLRQSEKILMQAHDLNPLNTDHYANLGRLYLWWGDATGGNDPSKRPLAVEYLLKATQRTPGNAQIRDELAVAYARNDRFGKAIETLDYSQHSIDPTFARTPFIKGQLLLERALAVRDALQANQPLPADGATDYGKLILEAGEAFSDTIRLDPTAYVDSNYKSRVETFVSAARPVSGTTNTTVSPAALNNVLTDTLMLSLQNERAEQEKRLADYLRERGVYNGSDNTVPADLLQSLFTNPDWAGIQTEGWERQWLDSNLNNITHLDALVNYALGYVYGKTAHPNEPTMSYTRALALEPSNQLVQQEIKK